MESVFTFATHFFVGRLAAILEAELRSESYPQVVMGAVVEENIVTNFCPNAKGSGKRLEAPAGIYREIGRSISKADSVCKASRRIVIVDGEIVESNFSRDEKAERSRSGLKLRPKKAMQSTELRIDQLRGHAIAIGFRVVPLEVISHFGFQLHVAM